MKTLRIGLVLIIALVSASYAAEVQTLTLSDAIEMALRDNQTVKSADARVEEAHAEKMATVARFGPVFSADLMAVEWNRPYDLDLEQTLKLDSKTKELLHLVTGGPLAPLEFHDKSTVIYGVTAVQPLTPLYSVYEGVQARSAGETAYRDLAERTRQETAFRTIEAYYRVLAVQKLRDVAKMAVDTIAAHVEQAHEFEKAEFIGRSEILTAEVELANAKEQLIRAESGLSLATSALAQLVGLPLDADLRLIDSDGPAPDAPPEALAVAQDDAVRDRPDLAAAQQEAAAMDSLRRLAWWQLTPTVAAVARWQHSDGIILFQQEEMFAGITVQWNFWDWGRTYHEARAAAAKARQSHFRANEATELIRLQVKQKSLELTSARERAAAAEHAVALAEENLRLQQLRFQEGLSTSINVTDAQTLLTKARTLLINARYDALTAHAALQLATGKQPGELTPPPAAAPKKGDPS